MKVSYIHSFKVLHTCYTNLYFLAQNKSIDFSLLSYNVLAQELLEKNAFLYDWSDIHVLSWEYRKQLLLNEIKQFNADVSTMLLSTILLKSNKMQENIVYFFVYLFF